MTTLQALFMGLLQGATELFPVSSLGHAVLVPSLLRWTYRQSDPAFVPFLTLLHLGTATALFALFWRDWVAILSGGVRASLRGAVETPAERLAMLLVVGTVPGGLLGFFGEQTLKRFFATPRIAAVFLCVNGLILLGTEVLRRRREREAGAAGAAREQAFGEAVDISFRAAAIVGAAQALALIPGISRSGVTISGGLLAGLRHQEAARFSFLLATPIIAAAGALEVPQLFKPGIPLLTYSAAAVLAGLAAYASARFLMRWFKEGRLDPYGWYCLAAGLIALALLR